MFKIYNIKAIKKNIIVIIKRMLNINNWWSKGLSKTSLEKINANLPIKKLTQVIIWLMNAFCHVLMLVHQQVSIQIKVKWQVRKRYLNNSMLIKRNYCHFYAYYYLYFPLFSPSLLFFTIIKTLIASYYNSYKRSLRYCKYVLL